MAVFTAFTASTHLPLGSTLNMTLASTELIGFNDPLENSTAIPDYDHDEPHLSAAFTTVYFTFRLLFSGFAIFGNGLTIVAVIRFEQLQSKTNFLICSLAAADMLGGSLTPLDIAHYLLPEDPIFVPLCLIDKITNVISIGTNLCSIMWIAVDRYIYIAHGLHYHLYVTRMRTFILIGGTWLFIVSEITAIMLLNQDLKMGMMCKLSVFLSSFGYGKLLMPQIAVYAVVTVAFYIAVGRIAYKQGKAIAALNQPYDTYEAAMNRQQKKIAKMMVTILGTYFACYTPQIILSVILHLSRTPFLLRIEKITVLIYWANTWLNPIIYAWKSEDFRVAFRKLLGLKASNVVAPMVPLGGVN